MKKLLIALALGMVLVLALASVASADNGPHGGFNGSTNACASCHRAHSANSDDGMLLVQANIWLLCTSCHNGTGAFTNVVDGYYDTQAGTSAKTPWIGVAGASANGSWGDAGVGLFGGGFVNARMLTNFGNAAQEGGLAENTTVPAGYYNSSASSWAEFNTYDAASLAPTGRPVTSRHDVYGATATVNAIGGPSLLAGTGAGTIWGSGDLGNPSPAGDTTTYTGVGAARLECTSCHNPHGNAGEFMGTLAAPATNLGAPVPSYRLLDFEPGGKTFEVTSEIGVGSTFWPTTATWSATVDTAGGALANLYDGMYVLGNATTGYGVTVPDVTTPWYSVNNDPAFDRTVSAYRGRSGSGEIYVANFAGRGDYMGRYYGYKRPSATVSIAGTTRIACWDGAAMTGNSANCAGTTATTAFNNLAAHDAMGYWCSTCHDRYLAPGSASRTTDSGDPGYHYRHRAAATVGTTGTSANTLGGTGTYTCIDCHNAHGTASYADDLSTSASYAGSSALLKADNRAVCIRCHAGAVNFFNITTSPTAPMVLP